MATVCSKWAESEPSSVTTVHLSSRVRMSAPPRFTIGSMAMVIPGTRRGARPARGLRVVRPRGFLVDRRADPVSHELAHDGVPRPLGHPLDGVPDIADMIARARLRHTGREGGPGG